VARVAPEPLQCLGNLPHFLFKANTKGGVNMKNSSFNRSLNPLTKTKSRLYNIWRGMKKRCYLVSDKDYTLYGGRGIVICDEWKNNYDAFAEWSINNGYNETLTIDRINTNGIYEPSNCRWVDMKTQERNRRNNLYITETKNLSEWCEVLDYPYKKAKERCRTLRRSNKPITFESVFDL
jgi:hypothetical protein